MRYLTVVSFLVTACYFPSGTVKDGPFTIRSRTASDLSHKHTIRSLHYENRVLVTDWLDRYSRNPARPDVVLYSRYDSGRASAGVYIFAGKAGRKVLIRQGHDATLLFGDAGKVWSSNGEHVFVPTFPDETIVNVQTWRAIDLQTIIPKPIAGAEFQGWATDASRFAVYAYPAGRRAGNLELWEVSIAPVAARCVGAFEDSPQERIDRAGSFVWSAGTIMVTPAGGQHRRPCA